MMAHDSRSVPEPRPLSAETLAALRRAVGTQRPEAETPNAELTEAVRRAAGEARAQSLRVEEVIVTLKQLLDSLQPTRGSGGPSDDGRLRERLITLCIKAYYGSE